MTNSNSDPSVIGMHRLPQMSVQQLLGLKNDLFTYSTRLDAHQMDILFQLLRKPRHPFYKVAWAMLGSAIQNGSPLNECQERELLGWYHTHHAYPVSMFASVAVSLRIERAPLLDLMKYLTHKDSSFRRAARTGLVRRQEEWKYNPAICFILRSLSVTRDPALRETLDMLASAVHPSLQAKIRPPAPCAVPVHARPVSTAVRLRA